MVLTTSLLLVFTATRARIILLWCLLITLNQTDLISFLVLISLLYPSKGSVVHIWLILLGTVNTLSSSLSFILWYTYTLNQDLILAGNLISLKQVSFTCDTFMIEKLFRYQTTQLTNLTSWNNFYFANSLGIHSFLLNYNTDTFYNLYNLEDSWLNPSLYIELNFLNNLTELLAWSFLLYFVNYLVKRWNRYPALFW
jgi:hypothetical protein